MTEFSYKRIRVQKLFIYLKLVRDSKREELNFLTKSTFKEIAIMLLNHFDAIALADDYADFMSI